MSEIPDAWEPTEIQPATVFIEVPWLAFAQSLTVRGCPTAPAPQLLVVGPLSDDHPLRLAWQRTKWAPAAGGEAELMTIRFADEDAWQFVARHEEGCAACLRELPYVARRRLPDSPESPPA